MERASTRPTTGPLWGETATAASSSVEVPAAVDVAVVGGGYTGLWTAYYLLRGRPDLTVLVLEAQHVGFGASGRNGGWVSSLWPVSPDTVARRHGRAAALEQLTALRDTVDEVGRVDEAEGLGGQFVKGGALMVARTPGQEARARADAAHGAAWDDGTVWLDAGAARERLDVAGARGATFTPHCARIHPRRLVDGLAATVRGMGAHVVEGARVGRAGAGAVVLEDGRRVTAGAVVVATEGWTGSLPGHAREVAPVYSLMVATEPLTPARWADVGLAGREVFADHGHVVIYGQRTDDGRIAFGGRGAPYHWGSAIRPEFDIEERVFAVLRTTLLELLPQLHGIRFTHAWGGPLGIARDWHPSVSWDP
ncbi:MAG TPA: FAD-dependent oxidoreductase, partial [Ornithinibacter sp.]|nr:FAD-dependent oxidoreductase [Ornithinibacter sp.]